MIYLAQADSGGKIKVGRSQDPEKRVNALSSARGEPMKILALLETHDQVETLLHRALNGPNSYREWHDPSPITDTIIEAFNKGVDVGPILDAILETKSALRRVRHFKRNQSRRIRRRKMRLTKSQREQRRRLMQDRIKRGVCGPQFGSLGGRPKGS